MEPFPKLEARMQGPGMAVFVLFFGIALLDALRGGHWVRALFWVAIGAAFWLLERRGRRSQPKR